MAKQRKNASLTAHEVLEQWQNGNISVAKAHVKRMTKAKFIDFIEACRSYGIMPYKVRDLLS